MIHLMLFTTVHIKENRHPTFQFATFREASELAMKSFEQGYLHVENVFIQLGEGTIAHIVSDAALALKREHGHIIGDWNLLICPPNSMALPPMPFASKELAETTVERGLRRSEVTGMFNSATSLREQRISFVRTPDHDEFHYISAPGTVVLVLSREDCMKRLSASGETKSKLIV